MKALSIRQPWATLIEIGVKSIEIREWWTKNTPERLAIHAGVKADARPEVWALLPPELQSYSRLRRGGLVAVCRPVGWRRYSVRETFVADCRRHLNAPESWHPLLHGLELADVESVRFSPWKGSLGYFDVPADRLRVEPRALADASPDMLAPAPALALAGRVLDGGDLVLLPPAACPTAAYPPEDGLLDPAWFG